MTSIRMQELTSEEVGAYLENRDEVIVPIGSTEVHGPHLPVGVDTYEAIDYAEGIALRSGLIVTPPIWFGDCSWHMHKPGTISLQPETVIALLKDIYTSLIEHGFRKIITVNGHRLANLPAIGIASRAIRNVHSDAVFACIDPLRLADVHRQRRLAPGTGQHGDEFETSHMLYKHPDLVKRDRLVFAHGVLLESRLVSIDALRGGNAVQIWYGKEDAARLAPLGHLGDPTTATEDMGRDLFEAVVGSGAEFIDDLRRWDMTGRWIRGATGAAGRELLAREESFARGRREAELGARPSDG
jgi:creatinine amidohydrolase